MLELKDFDCERTYKYYLIVYNEREEKKLFLDRIEAWRDSIGDRYFTRYEGIYYPYLTTEKRLLNIEILIKRVLDEK